MLDPEGAREATRSICSMSSRSTGVGKKARIERLEIIAASTVLCVSLEIMRLALSQPIGVCDYTHLTDCTKDIPLICVTDHPPADLEFGSSPDDRRIALVGVLGIGLSFVRAQFLSKLNATQRAGIVVFSSVQMPMDWMPDIRYQHIHSDELLLASGCLCCSMRSDLASCLASLFMRVLQRLEKPVSCVIVMTDATSPDSLVSTLRHAPFLKQRYRLAYLWGSGSGLH
jgi:hypothetical protein